ncbi:MAG: retention module-containing protein, partial [Pseudomonadota bacterium]
MRALKAGDVLLEGDTIVTMPGGQVQLAFLDGQLLNVLPNETFKLGAEVSTTTRPSVGEVALAATDVERVIQALERGGDIDAELDPTAAGLDGGNNNAGNSFVRLLRIAEGVDPLSFQLDRAQGDTFEVPQNEGLGIVPAAEAAAVPAPAPSATIALSAPSSVTEGGSIVYTATVSSGPLGTPLVITLSNGAVITIPVGALSATSAPIAVRPDDIYVQGTVPVAVSASSATGGGYATLGLGSAVVTNVNDDADSTTVVLSSATNNTAITEGGSITYTVTTGALVQGSALVVTLSNGQSVSIPVGQSSGTAVFAVRADDIYQQGTQTLTAVSISSTAGGNFEAVASSGSVNNTVVDDTDSTTVVLSSATNNTAITE